MKDEAFERYYHQSNWTSEHITLLGDRNSFTGPRPGYVPPSAGPLPFSPIGFFDLFWSSTFLHEICVETNRYAIQHCTRRHRGVKHSDVEDESETPIPLTLNGGQGWVDVGVQELRAWLGIKIYMGLKPLPARRDYWSRSEELFNCRIIPSVMTMRRWEAIMRCLHLTDNEKLERNRTSLNFDKIGKVRMLLNHFVKTSQELYNLEREVTVDELINPYKGKYCNFRQFMRDKPVRFGLKLWCLASSKSRYVYNLNVFLGKGTGKGPNGLGYTVCTEFLKPFYHRGHILVCDNFFSSPRLFHDLLVAGTWACGTVRSDRWCLPRNLKQEQDNIHRGRLIIRMHRHRQMACLSWQDSDMVFMLTTAADPWSPDSWVLRRRKGHYGQWEVPSSPIHLMYQEFMRGVDVTDQLRAAYPTLMRSHKWWHKCVSFVVDQSLVNAKILHDEAVLDMGLPTVTTKQFRLRVAEGLVKGFSKPPKRHPPPGPIQSRCSSVHHPERSTRRRMCVLCGRK